MHLFGREVLKIKLTSFVVITNEEIFGFDVLGTFLTRDTYPLLPRKVYSRCPDIQHWSESCIPVLRGIDVSRGYC